MNRVAHAATASMLAALAITGCGPDSNDAGYSRTACTANGSLQQLIDQAEPGDTVHIPAGTHQQSVVIDTPDLTIEGSPNPADTVLDGCSKLPMGMLITADRVTVRGLTFAHYGVTGLFFNGISKTGDTTPIDGFAADGIAAYNNGLYGIYAFEATNGSITNTYTSGNHDSGIYVGQCNTCNVYVADNTAERNAVGFEGTNSSGVWIVNNTFRGNRIGITPNTQNTEKHSPQHDSLIAGNLVIDNNQDPNSPEQASGGWGIGIAVGGGNSNTIINNRVTGHNNVGIAVTSLNEHAPDHDFVSGNNVTGNNVDLAYWTRGGQTDTAGNCFTGNTYETSSPADIETVFNMVCAGNDTIIDAPVYTITPGQAGANWRTAPDPTIPTLTWSTGAPQFGIPAGLTNDSFKVPASG